LGVSFREEHKLRVSENRVLWRIFGPVLLTNSVLTNSVIKLRRVRWPLHVERMVEMRNAYEISVGKPEGKIPFVRGWEDTIKTDLKEAGREDEDWIHLAQNRIQWWGL
jgi:hypothetical protein